MSFFMKKGLGSRRGLQTLTIQAPSSTFFTDYRSYADGRPGGMLAGQYIAIPSTTVGNYYFWFTQADSGATQRGFDPADWDSSLVGYTGVQVSLSNGSITATQVATALETALGGVYSSVTRTGSSIEVQDNIDAGSAFAGTDWDSRGSAGIWGLHQSAALNNSFAQNNTIFSAITSPALANLKLRAIQVRVGAAFVDQVRPALYSGGTSTDPTGSTLLYDFGQIPTATLNAWNTVWVSGDVDLPNAGQLWVGLISAGTGTTTIGYESSTRGDYDLTNLYNADASVGNVPANAAPSTFPAGGTLTGSAFSIGIRLIYEQTPCVSDGSWKRRWGVHVDAGDLASTTSPNANFLVGGATPPNVDSMRLDYIEVAAVTDPTFRLGVAQGGIPEDPDGAVVIWDGGRIASGPTASAWYRLTAPTGASEVSVDETARIWWWARSDGGQTVRFGFAGAGADPNINPMDWPAISPGTEPEYEAPVTNTNHSTDPDVPFESPFVADASDFLPGNMPGAALGFVVDGFVLT